MFTEKEMEVAVQAILTARHEQIKGYEPLPLLDIEMNTGLNEAQAHELFNLMFSNSSPCWNCLKGMGDSIGVIYDDASGQYIHETCEIAVRKAETRD